MVVRARRSYLPRIKIVFGKVDADGWWPLYHYTGHRHDLVVHDWKLVPELDELVARARLLASTTDPNLVILTLYPNGAFNIDKHPDQFTDLDPKDVILTISDGATRKMEIRPRTDSREDRIALLPGARENWDLQLKAGQWNVLPMDTNARYTHGVPKVSPPGSVGWRTSYIFRRAVSAFKPRPDGNGLSIRRDGKITTAHRMCDVLLRDLSHCLCIVWMYSGTSNRKLVVDLG